LFVGEVCDPDGGNVITMGCAIACWKIFHMLFAMNDAQIIIDNKRDIAKYCDKIKGFNILSLLLYILIS